MKEWHVRNSVGDHVLFGTTGLYQRCHQQGLLSHDRGAFATLLLIAAVSNQAMVKVNIKSNAIPWSADWDVVVVSMLRSLSGIRSNWRKESGMSFWLHKTKNGKPTSRTPAVPRSLLFSKPRRHDSRSHEATWRPNDSTNQKIPST